MNANVRRTFEGVRNQNRYSWLKILVDSTWGCSAYVTGLKYSSISVNMIVEDITDWKSPRFDLLFFSLFIILHYSSLSKTRNSYQSKGEFFLRTVFLPVFFRNDNAVKVFADVIRGLWFIWWILLPEAQKRTFYELLGKQLHSQSWKSTQCILYGKLLRLDKGWQGKIEK